MSASRNSALSGRVAFTYPSFRFYIWARFFIVLATEMQSVAVGWQVYEITRRPLDLGFVGLAQFLPGIVLFLLAGYIADRYDRRKVLMFGYVGFGVCSALLLSATVSGTRSVNWIYAIMVLVGVVRSLNTPASRAILPLLVPAEHFQNGVVWNGIAFQTANILGPAAGGLAYTVFHGAAAVYAMALAAALGAALSMARITFIRPQRRGDMSQSAFLAGFRYIWNHQIILGSISLDMFAVLLGGAVALLPVYAKDVLRTGPWGLGLLRCAPAIGAGLTAAVLAYRPLRRKTGITLFVCVAGFGLFTILFGVSRNMALSIFALILVGATDMVSVVIRAVLVQLTTPDEMRGRVVAVDMIFIGTSNELGAFESGATAQLFGTVPAVVIGGVGTLVVTALCALLFPQLRRADELASREAESAAR